MTGGRPNLAPPMASRRARPVILIELSVGIAHAEAMPSVNGHCAITAATRVSRAAVMITWPPAKDVPPQHDSVGGVDAVEGARVRDGRFPVLQLLVDVEQLAWLARTPTEMAVVEDQACVVHRGEAVGEGVEAHLLDAAQPVSHHDDRP